jgi:hypothetical protein
MKDEELFEIIKNLIDNEDIYFLDCEDENQKVTLCLTESSGSPMYEVYKIPTDVPKKNATQVDLGLFTDFNQAIRTFMDNGGKINALEKAYQKHLVFLDSVKNESKIPETNPLKEVKANSEKKTLKKKNTTNKIKLSVAGWGSFYLVKKMTAKEVKSYTDKDELTDDEIDDLKSESDGYLEGFNSSSYVYVDDEPLCMVESLIKKGKKHHKYQELMAAIQDTDLVPELKNAFLCIFTQKGEFLSFETSESYDFSGKKIPINFIEDFLNNLEIATGNIFTLNEWNGEDLNNEFVGSIKDETNKIIADGVWYDCQE